MKFWLRNFGRQEDEGDRKDKLEKIVLPDLDPDPNFPSAVLDLSRLGKSFTIMRHAGEKRHPGIFEILEFRVALILPACPE